MTPKVPVESLGRILQEYGVAIILAVVLAMGFRFFAIEAYRIPNGAMRPTLESGDTVFVTKWDYGYINPLTGSRMTVGRPAARGDLIVFSQPTDSKRDSIKRVIGLAGDQVEIIQGRVKLNGHWLIENVDKNQTCFKELSYQICNEPPLLDGFPAFTVPEGSVFVLGDLRTMTAEIKHNKNFGLIPVNLIKAKVRWVWLSIEPAPPMGRAGGSFSRIRFERMFQKVE